MIDVIFTINIIFNNLKILITKFPNSTIKMCLMLKPNIPNDILINLKLHPQLHRNI